MLPREFPPWPTVFSRFRRWRLDGAARGYDGGKRVRGRKRGEAVIYTVMRRLMLRRLTRVGR